MRNIPFEFQSSLNSGATTHCNCWLITRADGVKLGFTDHDVDISFNSDVFKADSALSASSSDVSAGLSIDNQQASGALTSDAITDKDIDAGKYDSADVKLYRVDWKNPNNRVLMFNGEIGEIIRNNLTFKAELRGMAHKLNQPRGRAYLYTCDAALGDNRCQVNTDNPANSLQNTILETYSDREYAINGLSAYENDWFTRGTIEWIDGDNADQKIRIKSHRIENNVAVIETWTKPIFSPSIGDTVKLIAGCDKNLNTCRDKFNNLLNFRGFPHFPGDDWAISYPNRGESHDGTSLHR